MHFPTFTAFPDSTGICPSSIEATCPEEAGMGACLGLVWFGADTQAIDVDMEETGLWQYTASNVAMILKVALKIPMV
jgi:hypothetical protein